MEPAAKARSVRLGPQSLECEPASQGNQISTAWKGWPSLMTLVSLAISW